jgi:hypothetical protein
VLARVLLERVVLAHRVLDLLEFVLAVVGTLWALVAARALALDGLARAAQGLLRVDLPAAAL